MELAALLISDLRALPFVPSTGVEGLREALQCDVHTSPAPPGPARTDPTWAHLGASRCAQGGAGRGGRGTVHSGSQGNKPKYRAVWECVAGGPGPRRDTSRHSSMSEVDVDITPPARQPALRRPAPVCAPAALQPDSARGRTMAAGAGRAGPSPPSHAWPLCRSTSTLSVVVVERPLTDMKCNYSGKNASF